MAHSLQISWPRILAEGTAIVVSILLAFWIQAWWDDRQDLRDLHELLVAVRDDFEASLSRVEYWRVYSDAKEESILELLEAGLSDERILNDENLDSLIGDMFWIMPSVPIETGALDSLFASGMIGKIRNKQLRTELASWSSYLEKLDRIFSQDQAVVANVLAPFFQIHGYLPQIARNWKQLPGQPSFKGEPLPLEIRQSFSHKSLLANNEFHNILTSIWVVQTDVQLFCIDAKKWLEIGIELIDVEISSDRQQSGP